MTNREKGSDRGTEVETEGEGRETKGGKRWTEREPNRWEGCQRLRARERPRERCRDDRVEKDNRERVGGRGDRGSQIDRQTEPERKWDTEKLRERMRFRR